MNVNIEVADVTRPLFAVGQLQSSRRNWTAWKLRDQEVVWKSQPAAAWRLSIPTVPLWVRMTRCENDTALAAIEVQGKPMPLTQWHMRAPVSCGPHRHDEGCTQKHRSQWRWQLPKEIASVAWKVTVQTTPPQSQGLHRPSENRVRLHVPHKWRALGKSWTDQIQHGRPRESDDCSRSLREIRD